MSQRTLSPFFDGEQGPILRFPVRDGAGYRDLASAAVEIYIEDRDGNSLGMRPGHIVQAKNLGQIDVMLRGRATDWDGLGGDIVLIPRFYYAQTMARAVATNLLANPSFDTDGNADGVADSWTMVGAKTATWAVQQNDPAPPSIFGSVQLVKHATTSEPDYIQQVLAPSMAAGDVLSVGCWHRASGGAGEAAADTHGLFFKLGAGSNSYARFRVGDQDWYFTTGQVVADTTYSAATVGVDLRGTTLSNRLDDAFAFVGRWYVFHGERVILSVKPCPRPTKNAGVNQIAGVGSFEQDSDADGFPDAWSNQASGVTFAMERNPANVSEGRAALKATLADHSGKFIRLIWRGRYRSGETWRARVAVKTVGALSAGVGTGGLTVALSTEQFDGAAQSATGNLPTNASSFTDATATLALTADRNALVLDINLNGYTGALYLDDVRLDRTVAA